MRAGVGGGGIWWGDGGGVRVVGVRVLGAVWRGDGEYISRVYSYVHPNCFGFPEGILGNTFTILLYAHRTLQLISRTNLIIKPF